MQAWPGTVVLLAGLVLGRLVHETALGSFVADAALVPVTAITYGPAGALAGACVVLPMLVKRALGNARPSDPSPRTYVHRLLYDDDPVP